MMYKETTLSGKVFKAAILTLILLSAIITLYPFLYIISMSISNPIYVVRQDIILLPKGFSTMAYKIVLSNKDIWHSYYNTFWYVVVGTLLNILMTLITAYPLTRRDFPIRKGYMLFITFTMFFSGGMIPSFILINKLGLYNTRWAIILPAAISAWNVIIARTYMATIPESLQESARLDGCNDFGILVRIIIPLCAPITAVVALFAAVGFWNGYFSAMLYLPNPELQPLQMYLMKIVVQDSKQLMGSIQGHERELYSSQIKYVVIVVAILPIICVYPFLQKYFVQGVMIGSIKE